jgi:hypothetical protein
MDAETVQRVVNTENALEAGDAPVAEHAGGDADHHRTDRADEARGGSDGDEAGDRAGNGHVTAAPPISVMNSRRFISDPKLRRQHCIGSNEYFDRG